MSQKMETEGVKQADLDYVQSLDKSGLFCSICKHALVPDRKQMYFYVQKHTLCSPMCLSTYQQVVQPVYAWIESMKQGNSSRKNNSCGWGSGVH